LTPRADDGGGNVSGAIILDQLEVARELLGKDAVARALLLLPPPAHAEIRALLSVSWCTIASAVDLHRALAKVAGKDLVAWRRMIITAGIERTLSTVWRLFLRVTSVEAIIKRTATIYAKSYDRGAMRAERVSHDTVNVILSEWSDVPDFELDAIACGLDVVLSLAKKPHARIGVERRAGGARFEVRLRKVEE
jgi:hypothetical protein